MIDIHRILNSPVSSNCYVISNSHTKYCIIIDPGTENNNSLLSFLSSSCLIPSKVILTHEHYDHCAGVNQLIDLFKINIICSEITSINITNSKLNFSAYKEEYKEFSINTKANIVNNNTIINFNDCEFQFLETPGHSPGSLCIIANNKVFTGDTFMGEIRTPLKLPGGSKQDYQTSLNKLRSKIKPRMHVYPGHGEPFLFQGFDHYVNSKNMEVDNLN